MLVLAVSLALVVCLSCNAEEESWDNFGLYENYTRDPYAEEISANVSRMLNSFFEGTNYDKRIRPFYRDRPVVVAVSLWIQDVSALSEVDMDFTLDLYFRQEWVDPRLRFQSFDENLKELAIGAEMSEKIWRPDTFFVNAKSSAFHHATMKNTFIRIRPSGKVFISIRLTVTASCPMDLTYFPMDSQKCFLQIESFGYQDHDIRYRWMKYPNESAKMNPSINLPQFECRGWRECNCTQALSTGNYSRLHVEIFFDRRAGFYMIQIYIPAVLVVIVSWVSFWIARDSAPARVALGITTVLTMTTLMTNTNARLPKVSYLKSVDVFLVTCFIFVFASLLEYAAVSYVGKRFRTACRKRRFSDDLPTFSGRGSTNRGSDCCCSCFPLVHKKCCCRLEQQCHGNQPFNDEEEDTRNTATEIRMTSICIDTTTPPATHHCSSFCEDGENLSDRMIKNSIIDKYSRIVFPVVFLLFNLLYWLTYINVSNQWKQQQRANTAIGNIICTDTREFVST